MASEIARELAELIGWTNVSETGYGALPGKFSSWYPIPQPDTDQAGCMDLIDYLQEHRYHVTVGGGTVTVTSFNLGVWHVAYNRTPAGIRRAVCEAARDALRAALKYDSP